MRNDHVTNNCAESFNSWFKNTRGKPIHTMFEYIRRKFMGRLQKRYQKGLTWEGKVTAEVRKKLEDLSNVSRRCTLIFAGRDEYEVLDEMYTL